MNELSDKSLQQLLKYGNMKYYQSNGTGYL